MNGINKTLNYGKTACLPVKRVKLQSIVTSSATIVVSLIFFTRGIEGRGWVLWMGRRWRLLYQYLCWSEWRRVEARKCCQVKVAGERVFIGHLECAQERKVCVDRMLQSCFPLSNLLSYNYFQRKSICMKISPCYQGLQHVLCVFLKKFCLTFTDLSMTWVH